MQREYDKMTDEQQVLQLKDRDDTHALAKRKQVELARLKDALQVSTCEVRFVSCSLKMLRPCITKGVIGLEANFPFATWCAGD
jgi:hypothetical protein